jgi:hypothetical protein
MAKEEPKVIMNIRRVPIDKLPAWQRKAWEEFWAMILEDIAAEAEKERRENSERGPG